MLAVLLAVCCLGSVVPRTEARCDNKECAQVVSKCLLMDVCHCNIETNAVDLNGRTSSNCTCCRSCAKCLGEKLFTCCECVNLCTARLDPVLSRTSTVEDLVDPMPALFSVLTEEDDPLERWTSQVYPVHQDLFLISEDRGLGGRGSDRYSVNGQSSAAHNNLAQSLSFIPSMNKNCSVAFMDKCTSLGECKSSCKSMGSARFRWFHEHGCCQCVSSTCFDYGKGRAMCRKCPPPEDDPTPAVQQNAATKHPNKQVKAHH